MVSNTYDYKPAPADTAQTSGLIDIKIKNAPNIRGVFRLPTSKLL